MSHFVAYTPHTHTHNIHKYLNAECGPFVAVSRTNFAQSGISGVAQPRHFWFFESLVAGVALLTLKNRHATKCDNRRQPRHLCV